MRELLKPIFHYHQKEDLNQLPIAMEAVSYVIKAGPAFSGTFLDELLL
jgi:hypothetical protein